MSTERSRNHLNGEMFALARTFIYVSLLVSILLLSLAGSQWPWAAALRPESAGVQQILGMAIGVGGALLALWCVLIFGGNGKGTPFPFDPPRRLVTSGPYKIVRNPMATGVVTALIGTALFYESWSLLGYVGLFFLFLHLMIVLYEEPTLRGTFGEEYEAYCDRVGRWWPKYRIESPPQRPSSQ